MNATIPPQEELHSSRDGENVIAIRINYEDGKNDVPVYIRMSQADWRSQLEEAMQHFTETVEKPGKGLVTVHIAENVSAPPIGNPASESIVPWEKYRELMHIETPILNPRIEEACSRLSSLGVDAAVIDGLRADTQFRKNDSTFRTNTEKLMVEEKDRDGIITALHVAKQAHTDQSYAKEKYPSSQDFADVPYVNHSIQIANMALELGMSPAAIQAALLHDVAEDTRISLEELSQVFAPEVIALVRDLTSRPDESREHYIERVSELQGEAKVLKCLDRLHNLQRGFCLQDPAYLERYIWETEEGYSSAFSQLPQLAPLQPRFALLLEGLKSLKKKLTRM